MSNGLGALGTAFGSSFENVPNMGNNQQGGQQGNAGQQGMQGGDVPAFNLPPPPQMGQTFNDDYLRSLGSSAANNPGYPAPNMNPMGSTPRTNYPQQPQRKYTPEEWSRIFGPNVDPDPSMIQQGPQQPYRGPWSGDLGPNDGPIHRPMPVPGGNHPSYRPMSDLSPDEYLQMLYQNSMGRQGDQGGMDFWRQQMANGMSQDQVRQAFDQSQEHQQYMQNLPRVRGLGPDDGPISQGQNPGYGPGVNNYGSPQMDPQIMDALRLAQQGQRPPMPQQGGQEMIYRRPSDDEFLQSLYSGTLGRSADSEGLKYWQDQLRGGMHRDQISQSFQRSPEYDKRREQQWMDQINQMRNPEIRDALRLAQQGQRPMNQ